MPALTDEAFRQLVRNMREAQRNYFAFRKSEDLYLSKDLEKRVDRELEQSGLFDREKAD